MSFYIENFRTQPKLARKLLDTRLRFHETSVMGAVWLYPELEVEYFMERFLYAEAITLFLVEHLLLEEHFINAIMHSLFIH
jgi:hypothetical protein